jgi:hypothetical protein
MPCPWCLGGVSGSMVPRTTTTDPWTYRDVDTLGVDMTRGVDVVGFEIEATGESARSTKRPMTLARAM